MVNKRPVALLLFMLALGVRLFYLLELKEIPYFDSISPAFDHYSLDISASNFARGDLLAHAPNNAFAPLYKYFLGVIYWLFGRNFYIIYSIQFAMGALASVLIYRVARDLFGGRAGVIAFLGFAFYTTEIIYEGIILREAFITFWGVVSFYLLSGLQKKATTTRLVFATLALSCLVQGRPNTIFCLPFVCVYLRKYIFHSLDGKDKIRHWLLFSGTLIGSFVPLLIQCYLVHGRFVFFDASGPQTFMSGNMIGYSGVGFDGLLVDELIKKMTFGYAADIRFLLHHIAENPVSFLLLYLRKCYFFFNDFESPSNISVYLYREFSSVLPWLMNHFAVFSAFGLVGIVLAIKNRKDVFLLYSYAFALWLGVIFFCIVDRYRLPVVPYYIIFAAYAVDTVISGFQRRRFGKAVGTFLTGMVLFYCFLETRGLVRIRDVDYHNLAIEYGAKGNHERVDYYINRILTEAPDSVLAFSYKGQYHFNKKEWEMAVFFFEHVDINQIDARTIEFVKGKLIQSLLMLGASKIDNCDEAIPWFKKALAYAPDSPEARNYLRMCNLEIVDKAGAQTSGLP